MFFSNNFKDNVDVVVLDWYLTRSDNEISHIAKELDLPESRVNAVINKYLKKRLINND